MSSSSSRSISRNYVQLLHILRCSQFSILLILYLEIQQLCLYPILYPIISYIINVCSFLSHLFFGVPNRSGMARGRLQVTVAFPASPVLIGGIVGGEARDPFGEKSMVFPAFEQMISWGIIRPNMLGIIWNYTNPRTGNPELNQPGFNGMIEGF